jgi:hypothetical protein
MLGQALGMGKRPGHWSRGGGGGALTLCMAVSYKGTLVHPPLPARRPPRNPKQGDVRPRYMSRQPFRMVGPKKYTSLHLGGVHLTLLSLWLINCTKPLSPPPPPQDGHQGNQSRSMWGQETSPRHSTRWSEKDLLTLEHSKVPN